MTLAEKYNVAMNRLELSAEARQRILGNIQDMGLDTPKRGKVFPFPRWKQWATLAACAAVVLLAAITLPPRMNMRPEEQQDVAQIANPYVDYETLADAAKAAGFDLTVPEMVDGYSGEKSIQVVDHKLTVCVGIVPVALPLRQLGSSILESTPKPSLDILTMLNCVHQLNPPEFQ